MALGDIEEDNMLAGDDFVLLGVLFWIAIVGSVESFCSKSWFAHPQFEFSSLATF